MSILRPLFVLVVSLGWVCGVTAAQDTTAPNVIAQLTDMLGRTGHSPTTDEIEAVEMGQGVTDAAVAKAAEPLLIRGLSDPDAAMRKYALAILVGMQVLREGEPAASQADKRAPVALVPSQVASYKREVGLALLPAVSVIGGRLLDDDAENRKLAAAVLGGFGPDAPAAVFAPLFAYLKRDDAPGAVGLAIVASLLQLGPVSDTTADAISRYVRRTDQSIADKTELMETIASKPNQSRTVNQALLGYLDSEDPSLRSRVILSLPAMELSNETFLDMKTRVATMAADGQESLPVKNAAKAVVGCWTKVQVVSGCPAY